MFRLEIFYNEMVEKINNATLLVSKENFKEELQKKEKTYTIKEESKEKK